MAIAGNKLLNLTGAKALYDDLRGRVDGLIDDTATGAAGDTDVVWSATKTKGQLGTKADATDPVFSGSISMGRYAGSAVGTGSTAVGSDNKATANYAHAEGGQNEASGASSHAEGTANTASGSAAHAEGNNGTASGNYAHTEGSGCTASGTTAHAEGLQTTASQSNAHAEGRGTTASGGNSHAEGEYCQAVKNAAHAEGGSTIANKKYSHAEGNGTQTDGQQSHAEGLGTKTTHASQHVFGEYNALDQSSADDEHRGNYVEIVGNGTADNARSNARTLDWSGNEVLAGTLTCNTSITIGSTTITEAQLIALLAML